MSRTKLLGLALCGVMAITLACTRQPVAMVEAFARALPHGLPDGTRLEPLVGVVTGPLPAGASDRLTGRLFGNPKRWIFTRNR